MRKSLGFETDGYKIPLALYLHVNKLNDFQKQVLGLFLQEKYTFEHLSQCQLLISRQIKLLSDSNWKPERQAGDMVVRPAHYDVFPIEPTFFNRENGIDWNRGNANKYICRFPFKNGLEDLRKAQRYLTMEYQYLKGNAAWSG